MKKIIGTLLMGLFLLLSGVNVYAACSLDSSKFTTNITENLSLPQNAGHLPNGSVLLKKDVALSSIAGKHVISEDKCLSALHNMLVGQFTTSEVGNHIYATNLNGLGIRLTLIIDKPGVGHREWMLPLRMNIATLTKESISTQDLKIRLELVKYHDINLDKNQNIFIPGVMFTANKDIMINIILNILAVRSSCTVDIASPQITLPTIQVDELNSGHVARNFPIELSMDCENVQWASLTAEGELYEGSQTIFLNTANNPAAKGVGIELLYGNQVVKAMQSVSLPVSGLNQSTRLPLSIRYAKVIAKVMAGKVKAHLTLHFNYL